MHVAQQAYTWTLETLKKGQVIRFSATFHGRNLPHRFLAVPSISHRQLSPSWTYNYPPISLQDLQRSTAATGIFIFQKCCPNFSTL